MEEDFGYDMFDTMGYYDGDRYEDSRNDYDRYEENQIAFDGDEDDFDDYADASWKDEGGEDYLLDMVMEDRLSGGDVDY